MAARRCSSCSTDWPNDSSYSRCPACQTSTWLSMGSEPLDEAEARSRANHAEFERFVKARDAQKAREATELLERALQ